MRKTAFPPGLNPPGAENGEKILPFVYNGMMKRKKRNLVLFIPGMIVFFLLLSGCRSDEVEAEEENPPEDPISGVVWYVSPSGDDSGAGSEDSPFRTIARALETCQPGETIALFAGTYPEAVRIRQPRITLRSRPGERALIQSPVDDEEISICVEFDVDSSGGKLQNLEITGGYYYAVSFETKWDWGGSDRGGACDVTVENCLIHHSGRDCVKIKPGCDRITIQNCEIHHSGAGYPSGTPDDDKNAEGIDNVNGDSMTVIGCTIHDIASTGIYFKGGATDCRIDRSRIYNCGGGGVMVGFDTSPEYFDLTVNPEYYEAIDGTVQNCIISDTVYAGIGLYASRNCNVYHNTLVNTAKRGHAPLYFGITFQDWEPSANRPASIGPELINNLVCQGEASPSTMVFIRYSEELGGLSALSGMPAMSNNLYFCVAGSPAFSDQRPGSLLMDCDLSAWMGHIAGDQNSCIADPLLDDKLHLRSGSPAIGRGLYLEEVPHDYDGDSRGNPPDIGADEA